MIPKECKRLAEVDFPIAVVSKHAAREKSIRHGHPSTLHLWWARRPLAACRAMLLGLLLPDPCDAHCPEEFKKQARELLPKVQGKVPPTDEDLRKALLRFIGEFSNWDLSSDRTFLEVGQGLVKAAHPEETPLVVDPFAGGGSIPLEALRLGCETFASDLNPVACLILKVMLEDIPRHGPELAEEFRLVGKEIKGATEKELAEFYPPDPDGSKPIAYLWARTVRCEAPKCGAEIPLVRSFWLCKKANRKRALRYKVVAQKQVPWVEFEIFEPHDDREVPSGTVTRAKASCICCGTVLSPERVRAQLVAQKGGADVIFDEKGDRIGGARLLAIVSLNTDEQGRVYRLATIDDYKAVRNAEIRFKEMLSKPIRNGLTVTPDESIPLMSGTFNVPLYGMTSWGDLFCNRQKLALGIFGNKLRNLEKPSIIKCLLAINMSHVIDRSSSLCRWRAEPYMETVESVYGRQALPMVWDFAEAVLLSESTGSFQHALEVVSKCVEMNANLFKTTGQSQCADACSSPLPDNTTNVWFTDPPYYFAIPYADLSDFFFVWLKRNYTDDLLQDPWDSKNPLTPKKLELCEMLRWDPKRYAYKDKNFFENGMMRAFIEGARILKEDGIGCVVFAHKTTEGWEALLSGMIQGGWTITGSWPIATEMRARLRARESAALATSVHLICRPRSEDKIGDWGEVLRELPKRVGDWMERLQGEGIRGADLVFACIGPALEIFSQYSKVVDAEEREIPLGGNPEASDPHQRGFLSYVWEVVGRTALEQVLGTAEGKARNGAAGAVEEDARLTALFLWTLQSTNGNGASSESEEETEDDEADEETPKKKKKPGFSLIFDVVRRFAQPLGIHLPEWEGRIIETEKGVVRLLSIQERAKALFGEDGAQGVADRLESSRGASPQLMLFSQSRKDAPLPIKGRKKKPSADVSDEALRTQRGATTLDRVHAAMLLQANGRANALRVLLKNEQDRGPDFLRLANALSALYPKESEEKRLLDAMLLAMPR